MSVDGVLRWAHLVAAAVWVGGMITVGALVPALRRAGATRQHIRAAARAFGRVAWTALAAGIITGIVQLARDDRDFGPALEVKIGLVSAAVGLAAYHQRTAATASPAARGAIQGLSLLLAVAIVALAVAL